MHVTRNRKLTVSVQGEEDIDGQRQQPAVTVHHREHHSGRYADIRIDWLRTEEGQITLDGVVTVSELSVEADIRARNKTLSSPEAVRGSVEQTKSSAASSRSRREGKRVPDDAYRD